jgi:outer membrane protein OmpA-like peptidoglycan-associated protein
MPPPPDTDGDGILDAQDRCPREAEDKDGFEDADGCIDRDNDADNVPDDRDPCMNEPEDKDGFADEDGCPDPDNDQDHIPDGEDVCPNEPGVIEERGCKARVQITESGAITIDEQIQFESGKDVILGQSYGILEAVRITLDRHPEVRRVRIEGHTDSKGPDKKNLKLSETRARAVAQWLVHRGIAEMRLEAFGCGELHPLADNGSEIGRQLNRRVAFQAVDPAPSNPVLLNAPAGCRAARISIIPAR